MPTPTAAAELFTEFNYQLQDKFIEYFYGDKKLVHLQILEMVKIGLIEREHACLHGNLNFYKKNINDMIFIINKFHINKIYISKKRNIIGIIFR